MSPVHLNSFANLNPGNSGIPYTVSCQATHVLSRLRPSLFQRPLTPSPSLSWKEKTLGLNESILEYYAIIMDLVNCNFISRLRIWLTLFTLVQPSFYFNTFYRTLGSITSRCFRIWARVRHSLFSGRNAASLADVLRYSSRFPKKSAWEPRPGNRA